MIGEWLALLCTMLPEVRRGAVLTATPGPPLASWPHRTIATDDLAQAAQLAASRAAPAVCLPGADRHNMIAARPLTLADDRDAVVVLELHAAATQQAVVLRLLDWGQAWLRLLQRDAATATADSRADVLGPLQAALAADTGHGAAALATALARDWGFERVCLGRLRRGALQLAGTSFSDSIGARTALARQLLGCMEETRQLGRTVQCRRSDTAGPTAHRALLDAEGCDGIASVPLLDGDAICGVLLCTWRSADPGPDALRVCERLAPLAGPLFAPRRRRLLPFTRPALRSAVAAGAIALALLALLPGPHRVTAQARVEGRVQRAIVAPVDGYLLHAPLRAGASIRQGEVIAQLDDHELQLERQRWLGQREEYRRQYSRDLAALNHSQMRIAQAQIDQAHARLKLLEDKLGRLRITAPIDGVIIKGDLSRAVGAPVRRGEVLFELAPPGQYRLILDVAESDIAFLRKGQTGRLSLTSLPDARIDFTIEQLSPVYGETEGEITYRTEASLDGEQQALRPGMSGLGKVDVGRRSYLWLATHKMFDWLRLKLWSLLP